MSSNKIGFLSASALYVAIFLAIWLIDFKILTIGEMGESKVFSISFDNIAGDNFGEQKQMEWKNVAQKRKALKKPLSREMQHHLSLRDSAFAKSKQSKNNTPPQTYPAKAGVYFDSLSLAEEDKGGGYESKSKSTIDSPIDSSNQSDLSGGGASIAQSVAGQNDTYFLAITRIINKFHAKASVRNLYGVVCVAFSINIDGELEHLRIIKSSGSAKLDNIALQMIRRASRAFPTPKKYYYIKTELVYKRS